MILLVVYDEINFLVVWREYFNKIKNSVRERIYGGMAAVIWPSVDESNVSNAKNICTGFVFALWSSLTLIQQQVLFEYFYFAKKQRRERIGDGCVSGFSHFSHFSEPLSWKKKRLKYRITFLPNLYVIKSRYFSYNLL